MRVHQQPAYVLINRPYSETSWLVEVFSRDYGRLTLIAKGARRLKSKLKGVLLPFQPVLLSWVGKGEIPTLTSAEIDLTEFNLFTHELKGDALVCGFYCNELMVNLLHRHDPHPVLFSQYHATITTLNLSDDGFSLSKPLRDFEKTVMRETGYEVSFEYEADGKTLIEAIGFYYFQPHQGFIRIANAYNNKAISGRVILGMKHIENLENGEKDTIGSLCQSDLSQSKHPS